MKFRILTQGSKHYSGSAYWEVSIGPIILVGRPCRDITRAKARAAYYVDSGRAERRYKYLTCDTTTEAPYVTPKAILKHTVREMDTAKVITTNKPTQ